ncbi:MAG: NAD(P)/FAD-dependent oxidoreductase [Flavobacteriales bacterium]|nr:NAD(P)/FAD-dependent oxidoreductase [Flavobacteriales bacterium]
MEPRNSDSNNLNIPTSTKKRIVIVGGGFAGLHLSKKLSIQKYQVVLIDKQNYHTFQPLLYQVATSGLEPDSIAHALRTLLKNHRDFYYRYSEVICVHKDQSILETSIGSISYDYLVIATGSKTNYFNNPNFEKYTMPMKSITEALDLRSLILQNFEKALLTNDYEERKRLMNFVIVGGGPTGVELAGALAELKNHVLPNDYPDLDIRMMDVHIVQSGSLLLAGMSEKSALKAQHYLEREGVHVWLDTRVLDYDGKTVDTNNKDIEANTMIWAAGVTGVLLDGFNDNQIIKGRYKVDEFNRIEGTTNVFALGDVACMITEKYPIGHPMVAQVAIQQGKNLNRNFSRIYNNLNPIPFQYKDKGSMATIGRNKAVVDIGKFHFSGFFAWLLWMFVHLISLVGFRNKLVALTNWIVQYFSYNKSVRLIIRPYIKD